MVCHRRTCSPGSLPVHSFCCNKRLITQLKLINRKSFLHIIIVANGVSECFVLGSVSEALCRLFSHYLSGGGPVVTSPVSGESRLREQWLFQGHSVVSIVRSWRGCLAGTPCCCQSQSGNRSNVKFLEPYLKLKSTCSLGIFILISLVGNLIWEVTFERD